MNFTSKYQENFGYIQWAIKKIDFLIFFLSFILLPPGLIFNIAELFILYFGKFKNVSMRFFFLLNCKLNIIFLVFVMIFTTTERIFKIHLSLVSDISCVTYAFILGTLNLVHSWLNVVIIADRLYFTLYPNKYSFKKKKNYFFLSGLLAVTIILNFPNLWLYLHHVESKTTNSTLISKYCSASPKVLLIRDTISIVFRTLIPFLLMFIMNIFLIYKIKKSKKKLSKKFRYEITFVIAVVGKSVLFLIVLIPRIIWIILDNYNKLYPFKQKQTFRSFSVLFEIASSLGYIFLICFDLFVQILLNNLFRNQFITLICKHFLKIKLSFETSTLRST